MNWSVMELRLCSFFTFFRPENGLKKKNWREFPGGPVLRTQHVYCRKGDPFQGLKLGSCLTLGNELSEETHVLTKQEILSGQSTRVESMRVREPRRIALSHDLQSQVLW